ncbi:MAG: 50S ribosomal protein L22 [Mariprofundales bacterium]|nr:50S ribosomal protein L22 [Mariprofundales bacterium]
MSEEVRAVARNMRISPQKARLMANAIRGLPVERAIAVLTLSPKKSARLFIKVLRSAVSNAEENNGLDVDSLTVTTAKVDTGMTLKRYRPKGMGRMRQRFHRHSHLTVAVSELG